SWWPLLRWGGREYLGLSRRDPCSWRAVLGVHNLQKHSPQTARRRIRRIMVHSEFKRETFENDVAVFELRSAVRYSLSIQPACLPPAALLPPLENSSDCSISGWGRTSEKGTGLRPLLKPSRPHPRPLQLPHTRCPCPWQGVGTG
uniref:Peptidase S1 domain-containing protein n=1 Tax=Taeniopygia guttata TaxID=59729 RepID=A0A674GJS2_TAEGU